MGNCQVAGQLCVRRPVQLWVGEGSCRGSEQGLAIACFLATWTPICWHTKELHNSPEWSITEVYLSGEKLTERVVTCSLLYVLVTVTKSSSQEAHLHFLSTFILCKTMPKVGQYFKGY